MTKSKFVLVVLLVVVSGYSALAQQRSAKRGIGWDEKSQPLSNAVIEQMAPGVAWVYNWGVAPAGDATLLAADGEMTFVPMCWNAGYEEAALRNYLTTHPNAKVLLGFNEPNFSAQSNMTPQQAADAWPRLEQLAQEFGLELVAPALNFTGERVGGRTWSPYEWLDEFFRLYPTAKVDYLALHCYMNYHSSNTWFATEYIYKDLYDSSKDVYGRYPNLVKYLNDFKEAKGHFPQMYLTEFCSWENDGKITGVDFQIDQMTQKVQALEQSELVAGYAWFMGNAGGGAAAYPYMSIFQTNTSSSDLSTLGKVYGHMSAFDADKWYAPGETILAKDYINAGVDASAPTVRPNTEEGSDIPLQVEWVGRTWMSYQVDVPTAGEYRLTLHAKAAEAGSFRIYKNATGAANNIVGTTPLAGTNDKWADVSATVTLPQGRYAMLLYNMSTDNTVLVNSLRLESTTGIDDTARLTDRAQRLTDGAVYDLQGRRVADHPSKLTATTAHRGIYICGGRKVVR